MGYPGGLRRWREGPLVLWSSFDDPDADAPVGVDAPAGVMRNFLANAGAVGEVAVVTAEGRVLGGFDDRCYGELGRRRPKMVRLPGLPSSWRYCGAPSPKGRSRSAAAGTRISIPWTSSLVWRWRPDGVVNVDHGTWGVR